MQVDRQIDFIISSMLYYSNRSNKYQYITYDVQLPIGVQSCRRACCRRL